MFIKNQITGITGRSINTRQSESSITGGLLRGKEQAKLKASGSNSTIINQQSHYNYMMTGILPADPRNVDTSMLGWFYRDCYLLDSTSGSAVDIMSVFPFSDWELRGLEERELSPFHDTCERLNLRQMMPEISTSYLTDGFFAGSLIYDPKTKGFIDTLIHDALQCTVNHSPFYNVDPSVTVNVGAAVTQFMASQSPYARKYVNSLPKPFLETLNSGSFVLDPVTTVFIARRGLSDRAYTSYLHRVLPMYLIEKTMFRGTLVEATKRQRAMSHITAGDETWTPTTEELLAYAQLFQDAEADPLGGWVSTRNAVQVSDIRAAGDFFKWTDMADVLVAYKMRALGISEAFLSGDACLIGSTQVSVCNSQPVSIESLCPVPDAIPHELPVGKWYDLELSVPNRVSESADVAAWSYQGYRDTFKVSTDDGHELTGTDNHPLWVMDGVTGECGWKRVDELKVGDLVAVE